MRAVDRGQGGEGQHRRSRKIARQQEPPRRAVGISRLAGGVEIVGVGLGQRLRPRLLQLAIRILGAGALEIGLRDLALVQPIERFPRPVGVALLEQGEVEQPFARIVDDVEMHVPRALEAGEEAVRPDAHGQAQLAHGAGAFGPVRRRGGQRREVALVVEARQRVVGLGLQEGGLDPPLGGGAELRHAAPVHQVRRPAR